MDKIEEKIIGAVDDRREDFINFYRKLVKIPSFTGHEQEVAQALIDGMQARGFDNIKVIERIPGHPNVFAYLKGIEEGPTYTFNGHMDVLPPQNADRWPYPPFSGHMEDGKIYGRGTVDMKAGTFGSFLAGLVIKDLNIPLKGDVLFTAVCDEEICGENGVAYLLKEGHIRKNREDDFGLNCEPTNLREMNIATKGMLRTDIVVKGKGAFSARPYLGINAINKACKLIEAIMELDNRIGTDETLHHPLLEKPSVTVAMINGGEASNLVPDTCTLTISRRMLPCENMEDCLHDYEEIIKKLHSEDPEFEAEIITWNNFRPPVELPPDTKVASAIRKAQLLVTGEELELTGSEGGTDASLIVYHTGLPMPVYGPGDYRLLGTVNEHITADDFLSAIKIYALSIYYTLGKCHND